MVENSTNEDATEDVPEDEGTDDVASLEDKPDNEETDDEEEKDSVEVAEEAVEPPQVSNLLDLHG